jgi:uncharacterized protein (TIGR03643 family)
MKKTDPSPALSPADVSAIIAMAWQDDTPFEALALQFDLSEAEVIALMRENLKTRSFRVWRMRVRGRLGKHLALRQDRDRAQAPQTQPQWVGDVLADGQETFPLPPSAITRQSLG